MTDWQIRTVEKLRRYGAVFAFSLLAIAMPADAADLRKSARVAAEWAISEQNAGALADSIEILLDHGAALAEDDPFSVSNLMDSLRAIPGGAALAADIEARRSRGQLDGSPRIDLILEPGEIHELPMTMVAREAAFIEARLWRGSDGGRHRHRNS